MNNIKLTAIRLIANAYLYGKEKNKECHGYRFDSSLLTARDITTIEQLNTLQFELNRLGWCFNIITFNDYVIQEKSWLGEMTKLSFNRVRDMNDDEVIENQIKFLNEKITNKIVSKLNEWLAKNNSYLKVKVIALSASSTEISFEYNTKERPESFKTGINIIVETNENCTIIYGTYIPKNTIVFSGDINKRWLDVIINSYEKGTIINTFQK